jgi:hypothetical protein
LRPVQIIRFTDLRTHRTQFNLIKTIPESL